MKTRWMLSFTMWHINGEVVTETYGMLSKGMLAKKNLMKPHLSVGISSAISTIICGTNFSKDQRIEENALKLQTIIIGSIRCHIHACQLAQTV